MIPPEKREEKFAQMRERMQKLAEIRENAAPAPKPERSPIVRPREPDSGLPKMLRVKQVAERLGVSDDTVVRWFHDRAVRIDGPGKGRRKRRTILISPQAVLDFMREHGDRS